MIAGQASLDPKDGEGRSEALRQMLAHPMLQDPAPKGTHARKDKGHSGDAGLDTALYERLGGLRVEYLWPSRDLVVTGAGVLWPADSDPMGSVLQTASRHRPLWIEVNLP